MLFTRPVAFQETLESQRVKKLLPTSATAAELEALDAQIKQRARFMARVDHAGTIARIDANILKALDPDAGWDAGQIRLDMKAQLLSIGYDPENPPRGFEPAKPGSLRDISSDARLNLVIDTNVKMANGYGRFVKANDPESIDDWPCWEFVRDQQRKKPRGRDVWMSRWVRAGGQLYGPARNRMIAPKDHPVWTNSEFSRFGNPYPPFDYNSGMGVEEVSRAEAEDLGVIKPSTIVQPRQRSFNQDVRGAIPPDLSPSLLDAVKSAFGPEILIDAGQFILQGGGA